MSCIGLPLGSGVNSTAHLHITLRTNGILDQHSTNGRSSVVHLVLPTPITHLESFNALFKRSYTNHTRHAMAALYDIIHDRLLVDLSREVIHGHKVFQLKHKPDRAALLKANAINEETYHVTSSGSFVTLVKKENNVTYRVNVVQSTCMCKYYHKRGYCKHILYSLN
jgi:hypothetical protein